MKTYRRSRRSRRSRNKTHRRRKGGMMRQLNSKQFNQRFMRQKYDLTPGEQTILDNAEIARLEKSASPLEYSPLPPSLLDATLSEEKNIQISEADIIKNNPWWSAALRFTVSDWIFQTCDIRNSTVNRHIKQSRNYTVPLYINYFLAIQILDQYLSVVAIDPKDYYLIAATAILLASKYEDVYALSIRNMVELTNGSMSKAQFIEAESTMVATLPYLYAPTIYTFFQLKKRDTNDNNRAYLFQLLCCASVIQQFIGMHPSKIVDLCINYVNRVPHDKQIQLPFMPFSVSIKGKTTEEQYAAFIHIYAAIMSVA